MKVFAEVRVHGYGRGAGDMDRMAAINVVMVRVGRIYFKNVTIGLNAFSELGSLIQAKRYKPRTVLQYV